MSDLAWQPCILSTCATKVIEPTSYHLFVNLKYTSETCYCGIVVRRLVVAAVNLEDVVVPLLKLWEFRMFDRSRCGDGVEKSRVQSLCGRRARLYKLRSILSLF